MGCSNWRQTDEIKARYLKEEKENFPHNKVKEIQFWVQTFCYSGPEKTNSSTQLCLKKFLSLVVDFFCSFLGIQSNMNHKA